MWRIIDVLGEDGGSITFPGRPVPKDDEQRRRKKDNEREFLFHLHEFLDREHDTRKTKPLAFDDLIQ